jgi:hypothetical protein
MAKVRAKETGYDGLAVRKQGEVFEWSKKPAKWMEVVGDTAVSEKVEDSEHAPSDVPPGAEAKAPKAPKKK